MAIQFSFKTWSDKFTFTESPVDPDKARKPSTSKNPKKKNPKDEGTADSNIAGEFMILPSGSDEKLVINLTRTLAPAWQIQSMLSKQKDVYHFMGPHGPVWIVRKRAYQSAGFESDYPDSNFSWHRDQAYNMVNMLSAYDIKQLQVSFHKTAPEEELGFLLGMDLAAYEYKKELRSDLPTVTLAKKFPADFLRDLRGRSLSVNLARHLVNTPPNLKNPTTLAGFIKVHFSKRKNLVVDVWEKDRLIKENMGLHWGVGQGSPDEPRLVILKYRPPSKEKKVEPIAFVGKGITFDSGGLDIKPSAGMRYMKKDMGGAAAVLGLACWASETQYPHALDFYLPLAENSVDGTSFRPSDVLMSRSGQTIEIHNTDAEGRLVLADALDVAVTQKEAPRFIIDVATLTGAIKVALGNDVAGLFSNDPKLMKALHSAGFESGDYNWPMPLVQKYGKSMTSYFADWVNATDSMGGAITAALFLQKFVRNRPWAHLDIYGWSDKMGGGNGQGVQCLIEFLASADTNG